VKPDFHHCVDQPAGLTWSSSRRGVAACRAAAVAASAGRNASSFSSETVTSTARLRDYAAAGARHFAWRIATTSLATQREQLEQLTKLRPMLSGS
jgi:hypothetical protein